MTTYAGTEGVFIASADCNTMSRGPGTGAALCSFYNLPYYPYLVYGDPDNVHEYEGGRDYASLLAFAEQNLGPVTPPAPTPVPPSPVPIPPFPTPVPSPIPSGNCPSDAETKALQSGYECLWQSGSGFTIPPTAVAYCDYLSSGYLGYYWSSGDYECATSARKTVSGSSTFCLWQDGYNGFSVPVGALADCDKLSQGIIGLVVPGIEMV